MPSGWLQFSLRRLLVIVTLSGVVLAVRGWAGWPVSSAAVCLALVVAAGVLTQRMRTPYYVILLCAYAPYAWLLAGPWRDYHLGWIGMWPVLPGLIPGAYFFHATNDALEFGTMACVAVAVVLLATWIAARGRRSLVATALILLALSIVNSAIAYALYRA
jgi:hypothetical protein